MTDAAIGTNKPSVRESASVVAISVVCPVYNEADLAKTCYEQLSRALHGLAETWEIIFVNDGSSDGTQRVLRQACADDPRVRILRLARNVGQQQATLVGLQHARGAVVVTMDADFAVERSHFAALLQPLREDPDCDVVSGQRSLRGSGIGRRLASHLVTELLNRLSGTRLKDPGSTFKAMRRCVVEQALRNDILAQNLPLFVAYSGFSIREVVIPSAPASQRPSRYRLSTLMMALALVLLNYSSGARTLAALLIVGGGLTAFGFALGLWLFIKGAIFQTVLPTNMLLASLLGMLFGGQFIAFSFLGYKLESLMRNLGLRSNLLTQPGIEP